MNLLAHVRMMLLLLQTNDLCIGHGHHLDKAMDILGLEAMALGSLLAHAESYIAIIG
jgi:hypothetical protein